MLEPSKSSPVTTQPFGFPDFCNPTNLNCVVKPPKLNHKSWIGFVWFDSITSTSRYSTYGACLAQEVGRSGVGPKEFMGSTTKKHQSHDL